MKIYSKTIYLHNIKINFNCNYLPIFSNFCEQLKFPKFRNYNKYIEIDINLSVINEILKYGRSDVIDSKNNDFFLNCWLKNIAVQVNPKQKKINAQLIHPCILQKENLLHLIIISPLQRILGYYNIFLIHSAVVSKLDKGLLICGGPGIGKSTLTAALLAEGYNFLSDEFAILRENEILSFPLKMKLDRKSLKILKLNKNKKFIQSFYVQDCFGVKVAERCSPLVILFIRKSNSPSKPATQKVLNIPVNFTFLVSDKVNSLSDEKNILVRRRQIQALSNLAQRTKGYCLSYSLNQIKKIAKSKFINNLL